MRERDVLHDELESMELALFLNDVKKYCGKKVCAYRQSIGNCDENGLTWVHKVLGEYEIFVEQEFTYLYYGNEFCEYRIPSPGQVEEFLQICKRDCLLPVFVTPVVTDFGIERITACLDILSSYEGKVDVVINDYGVMELLKKIDKKFGMIAGRVLDKLSHEARANHAELQEYYGKEGMKYATIPGILSEKHRKVLEKYGVNRYEFDCPKVGFDAEGVEERLSLYWPYNYETTGRVCVFRSLDKVEKEKFLVGDMCKMKCMSMIAERIRVSDTTNEKYYLLQAGNTIFYIDHTADFQQISKVFDRVILQIL